MRSSLLSALLLLTGPPAWAESPFLAWDGLAPGPHAVGFRLAESWDASRPFGPPRDYRGAPRPFFARRFLPVSIWYPAAPGGQPMRYGDYVDQMAWGPDGEARPGRRDAELRFVQGVTPLASPPRPEAVSGLLGQPVLARRDAPPREGRFPVVVYAPGQAYPAGDNSVLCEYLASHGYVVLAAPSVGRDTWRMGSDLGDLEAQARDLEYLAGFARTWPQADTERLGTVGYSWGGLANVLFAVRDTRVKALVSLDGAVRHGELLQAARSLPFFAPERLRVPSLLLHCSPEKSIPGFAEPGFFELARHADVTRVVVAKAEHHDLSAFSSLLRRASEPGASRDWTAETRAYEALCRATLGFLDAHLKGQARDLVAAETGRLELALTRRAVKAPPSVTDVRDALEVGGAAAVVEIGRALAREARDSLAPLEAVVNATGYECLFGGKPEDAATLFALNVELFPRSANARDSLGEACLAVGRLDEAEASYREEKRLLETAADLGAQQKAALLASAEKGLAEVARRRVAR